MTDHLPFFRYHPNPIGTGAIEESPATCRCCGKARGHIYVGPVYSIEELRSEICPWCIADGSAASRFDASFADSYPLSKAGIPVAIIDEIHLKTPAYTCWQEPEWLSHCGDACEFHGDAPANDVEYANQATKNDWMSRYKQDEKGWKGVADGYNPGGDSAIYKFVCRHCNMILFGWDLS